MKYKSLLLLFLMLVQLSSCKSKEEVQLELKSECDQIKDIVTDCMSIHRGALDYIKNCGDISLKELKEIQSCEEILNHIENK